MSNRGIIRLGLALPLGVTLGIGGCGGSDSVVSGPTIPSNATFDIRPYCFATQSIRVIDDGGFGSLGFTNSVMQKYPPSQFVGIATLHSRTWMDEVSGALYDALVPADMARWQASVGSRAEFQALYRSWNSKAAGVRINDFVQALVAGDTRGASEFAFMAAEFWVPPCWCAPGTACSKSIKMPSQNNDIYYGFFRNVSYPSFTADVFSLQLQPVEPPYIPPASGVQLSVQTLAGVPTIVRVIVGFGVPFNTAISGFPLPEIFVARLLV